MTDEQKQLQQLKDMLELAVNQRSNAQNECLQIGAELVATKRKLAEVEAEVAELKKGAATAKAPNGHDTAQAQAAA